MRENKLMFLFLLLLALESFSQIMTSTGFYYPTGRPPLPCDKYWLDCDGDYFYGYCHLGHDFIGDVGDPVFAIADGTIVFVSYNDWGKGNVGLLAAHYLNDGRIFLAIYGHLKYRRYRRGQRFMAGEFIGRIGKYPWGEHLHFGIFRNRNLPKNGWGRMRSPAKWPYNNLTDPIRWINEEFPGNESDRNSVLLFVSAETAENGDILFKYHKLTANADKPIFDARLITLSVDTSYFCLKNFCMGIRKLEDLPNFVDNSEKGELFIARKRSDFIWLIDMNLSGWNFGHGPLSR